MLARDGEELQKWSEAVGDHALKLETALVWNPQDKMWWNGWVTMMAPNRQKQHTNPSLQMQSSQTLLALRMYIVQRGLEYRCT